MRNQFIFALIIFSLLLIVPTIALSYFEDKIIISKNIPTPDIVPEAIPSTEQSLVPIVQSEPYLIKVYDLSKNEVIVIDMEEYLKGVVASEMPAEFEPEALKAQAVTARTYLLYKIKKYPDGQPQHSDAPICTGTHCQVWTSKESLIAKYKQSWYDTYWPKIETAVNSTTGQILTYENKIIEPLFHSTSGGRTENSEDVFTAFVPYLRSVDSPYEDESPKLHQSVKIPVTDFISKIKGVYKNADITPYNLKESIVLSDISEGGKVKSMMVGDVEMSGRDIRSIFNLNSANFSFIQTGNEIEIVTTGYGHGVGMSQWGAQGMAEKGFSYKEILKHYYTGIDIVSMK